MRKYWFLLLILLAAYLLTGVRQVRPGERAVVSRWGRVVDTPGPGLWVGFPYGIDRVQRVAVDSVRRIQVGFRPDFDDPDQDAPVGQLLTGDHNLVNVEVAVDFSVNDRQVVDYAMRQQMVEGIVGRVTEAILSEWIAAHTIDAILISAKAELPGFLAERLIDRLRPYQLGIDIQGTSVSYLRPPSEVQAAFDEVTRAQAAIRAREHDANQQADRQRRQAQAEADRIQRMTQAYRTEQLSLARADADTFGKRLQQYQRLGKDNPEYLNGIWWQEIGKLFATLRENGRIDLLDHHLNRDGLDLTTWLAAPEKKK